MSRTKPIMIGHSAAISAQANRRLLEQCHAKRPLIYYGEGRGTVGVAEVRIARGQDTQFGIGRALSRYLHVVRRGKYLAPKPKSTVSHRDPARLPEPQ